ncbi:conserved hypothetical protein [Leishmania mexicana MHOM/GT/2001/U1103]|uniref:Uncharacterized protein n=1 Tax=Leishmania mexicana (strain MHOM/GT/2001/U1103) TaxID=929439 RepID=E9AMG8_LEIMU|nr:conserved hypothetical protein [Leishmania mexicana MHOM/GT/2001/U1103]CBZ24123.1 conserved hypothetical protein [Leishmania mexicana MHOM/GT/2001/U1103]
MPQRTAFSTLPAASLSVSKRFASTTSDRADARGTWNSGKFNFFGAYRVFRRERSANRSRQYTTLSMYLDMLPPGFRELLLWSPLFALLHFTCRQARVYYLDEEEPWYYVALPRRWRCRPDGEGSGVMAHVSSLLKRAPPSSTPTTTVVVEAHHPSATPSLPNASRGADSQGSGSTTTIVTTTYAFRAAGVQDDAAAVAGAPLAGSPPVASFHEVRAHRVHADQGASPETMASTPPPEETYRYGVWGAPLVVIRNPATQRVIGYTTDG